MTIRYPNGKKFQKKLTQPPIHLAEQKKVQFANRGQSFEEAINQTNDFYLREQLACIHKKPTPVQVVRVEYPARSRAVIREAYYRQASTTDYNGVFQGKYIDFEAKETKNKTCFPLQNIHAHQMIHMKNVMNTGGITFLLIHFRSLKETYLMYGKDLFFFWERQQKGGRKSITYEEVVTNGLKVPSIFHAPVHYLPILEKLT
ncbi:MAG: Holliday junction resolvase RecU [Bacillales bacterium]|nr:Holliday junction resolvase RecU [Bacillales bacterium]